MEKVDSIVDPIEEIGTKGGGIEYKSIDSVEIDSIKIFKLDF